MLAAAIRIGTMGWIGSLHPITEISQKRINCVIPVSDRNNPIVPIHPIKGHSVGFRIVHNGMGGVHGLATTCAAVAAACVEPGLKGKAYQAFGRTFAGPSQALPNAVGLGARVHQCGLFPLGELCHA